MTIIQLILSFLISSIYFFWLRFYRVNRIYKALLTFIYLLGIFLIALPQNANELASLLGVGRGADLITYFSIIVFLFLHLRMYAKTRKLQQNITHIVREYAINSPLVYEDDAKKQL